MSYHKVPHENWFQKGMRFADSSLKMYGTAQGLYNMYKGIAGAAEAMGPMLARAASAAAPIMARAAPMLATV